MASLEIGLAQIQMGEAPLALTSISLLRSINRNDLAVLLEDAVRHTEVNAGAGTGTGVNGNTAEGGNANSSNKKEASVPSSSQSVAGTTPVEISLKGKVVPLKPAPVPAQKKK